MTIKGAILIVALLLDIISIIGLVKINPILGDTRNTIIIWVLGLAFTLVANIFYNEFTIYITPAVPGGGGYYRLSAIIIGFCPGLLISFIWSFLEEGPPQLWKKRKH